MYYFLALVVVIFLIWYLVFIRAKAIWLTIDSAIFIAVGVTLIPASWYMSYRYSYAANENTKIVGAPIPSMIWQRDSAAGPWLDFIGIGVIVAPVFNFIIFASLIVIPWVIASFFRRRIINSDLS